MSVVAAKVYDDRIEFAADSMRTRGNQKFSTSGTGNEKLLRCGETLVGSTGSSEEKTMFRLFLKRNSLILITDENIFDYMNGFGKFKKELCGEGKIENSYIIAGRGGCYTVSGDYGMSIYRVNDYTAIGSGGDFALAAMYLGSSPEEAVNVACALDTYVDGPVITESVSLYGRMNKGAHNEE